MSCAPLICLIVWTVLFEGVEIKDGMPEAIIKFINFDNLTQHLANVFMIWIDFYLNDLSVISSHYKLMYLWMLTYTLFHSILWIKTCFLAYPFMRLSTPIVFVWFIGISGMHGIFFFLSICLSNKKRRAMDKAHGIDMKTIGNGSGSSGYGGVDGTLSSSSSGSTISPAVDNNHRRWGSEINSSSYLIAPPS